MSHDPSSRSSAAVLACLIGLPILVAVGCGPRHVLAPPDNLPESIGVRKLWNTPNAYIYAAQKEAAGETETWVDTLTDYVVKTHERPLGKGLIVVLDKNEEPLMPSFEAYVRLFDDIRKAHPRANLKAVTLEERREKLEEGCISEDAAIRLFPIEPTATILTQLGLPQPLPEEVAWVMSCPSQRLMEAEMSEIAPALVEKKKGKAFRIMTAWAMPMAVTEAAKSFQLVRDDFAFRLWCTRQTDYTPKQCLAAIEVHMGHRARQISPYIKGKPEHPDDTQKPEKATSDQDNK